MCSRSRWSARMRAAQRGRTPTSVMILMRDPAVLRRDTRWVHAIPWASVGRRLVRWGDATRARPRAKPAFTWTCELRVGRDAMRETRAATPRRCDHEATTRTAATTYAAQSCTRTGLGEARRQGRSRQGGQATIKALGPGSTWLEPGKHMHADTCTGATECVLFLTFTQSARTSSRRPWLPLPLLPRRSEVAPARTTSAQLAASAVFGAPRRRSSSPRSPWIAVRCV